MFLLIFHKSLGNTEDLPRDFLLTFTICHCVQMAWTMSSVKIQLCVNNTYET